MKFVPKWTLAVALGASLAVLAGPGTSGLRADEAAEPDPSQMSVVEAVNHFIKVGYEDNEITPSEPASDEEWVRRVYLDVVGRIPTLEEAKEYLEDESPRKRSVLVDKLLESPDYIRNQTTIWTNNCIGRGTPRRVSRRGMEKFFREAFAKNRPWDEVVVDIVTAEGHFEENGAVNYTLAQLQMPDDAVQLTAKTTKLFLGMQVQCTQCHNHPFNNWQQAQFWEFNSFFRQVRKVDHRKTDPNTGRQVDDYSEVVTRDFNGPVYFEKRSGLMQVAFPKYMGKEVAPDAFDRRKEFGKLLVAADNGETPLIAKAFVNRMWGHFFGYGFTRPVDDMGPHNSPSHPEVLDRLAEEFVDSQYDVKKLIQWITSTDAYSLTSQYGEDNEVDDPGAGEVPLFSHMYVKSMQAEQLYDSLIVASNAHKSGRGGWEAQEQQRRRWMQQFVVAFDTDENDEATTFNGTIPQALMMMNSELIDKAVSIERGSFLFETFSKPGSEATKMQELYLAALGRRPTRSEANLAQRMVRSYGAANKAQAYQDLFWALLNSNEFIFNH
ncbi:MAG: DUF1549 and DUF1553 domain-containing protein [Planctomycetaceae bacterium]|nr:DUF1549 and DUF1553 domain-containing protein [Planctomycetaceae bacterium]